MPDAETTALSMTGSFSARRSLQTPELPRLKTGGKIFTSPSPPVRPTPQPGPAQCTASKLEETRTPFGGGDRAWCPE